MITLSRFTGTEYRAQNWFALASQLTEHRPILTRQMKIEMNLGDLINLLSGQSTKSNDERQIILGTIADLTM